MCQDPIYMHEQGVNVPCGRCPPCLKRRVDSWVFRLRQQEKVSEYSHFITLTYDPAHVPISENGFMTLDKKAFPLFMKRLRKLCPGCKLSYYACGEYGSKNKRPHYHAVVFNVPNDAFFYEAWSIGGIPFGAVHVGQVSGDSIAYCTKYMHKTEFRSYHARDDRQREFSLMSKGMGVNYVTDAVKKWHNDDVSRMYCVNDGGGKIALPRYYRERIYDQDAKEEQRVLSAQAAIDKDNDNREYHARVFKDVPDYDYLRFTDDQRKARIISFTKTLKDRDI